MPVMNTQIVLASRPQGWVKESDFRIQQVPLAAVARGQVLLKIVYLSLDPYMRGRMNEGASYAANVQIGDVMVGETISEVVESSHPGFQPGDTVSARAGWQGYALSDGAGLRNVDTRRVPASAYLGAIGMPGVTAWYGLLKIGEPKEGETVVVSAASGAVGSVVGEIAKLKGCRDVV